MKLTSEKVDYLNVSGVNHVYEKIMRGLEHKLSIIKTPKNEINKFQRVWGPGIYSPNEVRDRRRELKRMITLLNDMDYDNLISTEGWEQAYGLNR